MRRTQGTTLIVIAVSEGVAMVADDLLYELRAGAPVPAKSNVRKIFAMGSILIGTAGTLRCKDGGQLSTGGELSETVSIEYKSEDWILEFIKAHRSAPRNEPQSVSNALYEKMRLTFKPVEVLLEHGAWSDYSPGDRFVTYIVAGYAKGFKNFQLFELGAEFNSEGNGLRYIAPFRRDHQIPHEFYLGEDEFLTRAAQGVQPQVAAFQRVVSELLGSHSVKMPKVPQSLQRVVATAVGLVKTEAEFNPNKVGKTVYAILIDRLGKKTHLAVF